ncbi:glycosyltransferase [Candidatus Dojkabacteria bacterium]|jgi:glycosyltransferase involved in cell wall biosynthesis|nr:glycosyltransferase [Candidatus Dojkabacteria bacterium]
MKIQLMDSWNGKFSTAIAEHWRSLGHEVLFNGEYKLDEPADLAFFYTADNSTQVGVKECNAKKIFVQAVDIEIWAGQPDGIDWSKVDGCITMAQHTSDMVKTPENVKRTILKPGIDINKFTLRKPSELTPVRRIAYVVGDGRIWDVKRFDIALQMLYDVKRMKPEYIWQLHIRGTYSGHVQYNAYCEHLIKALDLKDFIFWVPRVDDLNAWLEDKDYFILPSTKEAFSYATAEAMAKGIKPIINNWQSAKETWGPFVSNSYLEMLEKLLTESEPEKYRKFVEDNYNQEVFFKKLDEFMGIGGGN